MTDVTREHAPLLGHMNALVPELMKQLGVTNGSAMRVAALEMS